MIKNVNKSVKGGQKAKNDDHVFCKTYNDPLSLYKFNLVALAAVADGVGSVEGGDKASAIAVKELESRAERHKGFGSLKDIDEFFKNIYKEINQIILKEQENQNFPNMCTTLVSAGLFMTTGTEQCYLFMVNCGDSPLLCIDTDRDEIELLSAIHHTGNHLTQYLGKRNLEIHNSYCQCPKNGFILLCSDGLTGNMASSPCVSKEEIKKYLVETKNIDEASGILIRLAQYKGSSDDISVAILEMGKPKRVKPKRLTPIAYRRYRAIAERLIYAACILISIFTTFYYRSNFVKSDKELCAKNKEIGKLNELVVELRNALSDKDQKITKLSWDLDSKYADIISLGKDKERMMSDTKKYQKDILALRDKEKTKVENEKAKEHSKKVIANPPKNPAGQAMGNTGSGKTGQGIGQTGRINPEQGEEEPTQGQKVEGEKRGVSEFPQIENNPEKPKDGEDKKDNEKNGVGISDSKLDEENSPPDAKGKAEDSATKNGKSEPESMNKEALKPTPDTSENQKKEEVSKKGNNKELNKPTDDKTWLMIKVKCENKPLKDAKVYIDGKLYNKTGNNGELKIETSIGKHTLKVEKINHKPWCEPIDFQPGGVTKDIELEKGTLK